MFQDDAKLHNICTPKIRKQNSSKVNSTKPTKFASDSTNVCGTSIHIFTVDKPNKKIINRPFTAPTK